MKFPSPLISATLIKRYKRFLADVTLADGSIVTAHCPNTGSMKTCGKEGDTVYLSHNDDPKRKLKYTWELTKTDGGFIGVNTHRPNAIVKEALLAGAVKELSSYKEVCPEKKRGDSRLDFYLPGDETKPACWVEVKNVTLLEGDELTFPDAVSVRALKHIKTLEEIAAGGERAVLLFLLNRPEGSSFRAAHEIHPEYAEALEKAEKGGVEVLTCRVKSSTYDQTVQGSFLV